MKRATGDENYHEFSQAISIHALVKRATKIYDLKAKIWNISIHALVKRATHGDYDEKLMAVISIHALVKRAT